MARITVEDCTAKVPDRFELVLLAAERARQIGLGTGPLPTHHDKNGKTVMALREIADGRVSREDLLEDCVVKHQKLRGEGDVLDDDTAAPQMMSEEALAAGLELHARQFRFKQKLVQIDDLNDL